MTELKTMTHRGRALVRYRSVNPISDKRRKERREYIRRKNLFLAANLWCAWGLAQVPPQMIRSSQVHHKYGRIKRLLLWEPGWLAVSQQGSLWIHGNIVAARALGLICEVGCWNDFERATKCVEGTKQNET